MSLFFLIFACSNALRSDPNSPEALALRGLVLFLSGKLLNAPEHTSSALRLDPEHTPAMELRRRIRDIDWFKEEGFKAGRLHEAIDKYT
jgi:DnaJ family protein C protein 7